MLCTEKTGGSAQDESSSCSAFSDTVSNLGRIGVHLKDRAKMTCKQSAKEKVFVVPFRLKLELKLESDKRSSGEKKRTRDAFVVGWDKFVRRRKCLQFTEP